MTNKEKLQKEYSKIVGEQINSGDEPQEDMYPIMSEIYHWGYRNISNKELKRIIERNKK
tara:strand:- start:24 stop:200 length:177 start_codon:yes stop_codon:yes gene_type:complete